ncbi:hypothetical protein L0P88_16585 [Muricauda sp. SCSIO 64092]|uniref:hypothetical protein n=1 Tax=Allomuricauda sp. SCSIO 64092 TaxID=2908842 RepID=UPI001FF59E73|nr:hypothetical protein [Muricauda sp. SCSIO 64092]UOY05558.1 hypothetical protein L0P88_16585 [Muricauda sp. SCSIO 64092]
MGRVYFLPLFLIVSTLGGCCFYGNCEDDDFIGDQLSASLYEPVFLDRSDFEKSVQLREPMEILNSGKIYVKDNYLFVNEVRKGFHVFDNSNPQSPIKITFIEVPGSTDLAIRENIFYINQATDLIAADFDFGTNSLTLTKRIENTFPELLSPDGFYAYDVPLNSVVVDWKLKK